MTDPDYFYFTVKYVLNKQLLPFQCAILKELWTHPFPMLMASRGGSKSWLLAMYSVLRSLLKQGSKIVICGAGFRQSKIVFEYMENIWLNAPVLRDICGSDRRQGIFKENDRWTMRIGESTCIAIPVGTGEKIRGLRANTIVTDEFSCLAPDTLVETAEGLLRIQDSFHRDLQVFNQFGELETPTKFIKTPKTDVYQITTRYGYSFKCSSIHKVLTKDGWKIAKDLTTDDYLIFDNKYEFPTKYMDDLDERLAWFMGLAVAEGSCTSNNTLTIYTTDIQVVNKIKHEYADFSPKIYDSRPAYTDYRGWNCKHSYMIVFKQFIRDLLHQYGIEYTTSHGKQVPWAILQSPRSVVISFLSGLFEGDGSAFLFQDSGKTTLGVAYYSVSELLVQDLHVILKKLGYLSCKTSRDSKLSENRQWILRLNGKYAYEFGKELNIPKWQNIIKKKYVHSRIKKGYTKVKKGWRSAYWYAGENVYLGEYRTEEEAFKVSQNFGEKQPDVIRVKSVEKLPTQEELYDYFLPQTHSFYANGFIQHNSINDEIYENVIAGFAAVSADPYENVRQQGKLAYLKKKKIGGDIDLLKQTNQNQSIISGTAYYTFNHFYKYWKRYKDIITSGGDEKKLQEIFNGEIPEDFDWKDYCIIRIPYDKLPRGMMDEKIIGRAKATLHNVHFQMEYGCVFGSDTDGFFRRSLIESCVTNPPIELPSGKVMFHATVSGLPNKQYVYGIDPAAMSDNFAVVILELCPDHNKIVYSWTTNKKKHLERLEKGQVVDNNFYGFVARKIRELMTLFPCSALGIDSQGGGHHVYEALNDTDKMIPGEPFIWPVIIPDKEQDTDGKAGSHILHLINFADANWTREANHGMKKDLEDKRLLFPFYDSASIELASIADNQKNRVFDTLEDCVAEIEEMKDEISTIVMTQTPSGREHWDTPEIKLPGSKKGRMRKDRYSAVLIANAIARGIYRTEAPPVYTPVGGFIGYMKNEGGVMYTGPEWFVQASSNQSSHYGAVQH